MTPDRHRAAEGPSYTEDDDNHLDPSHISASSGLEGALEKTDMRTMEMAGNWLEVIKGSGEERGRGEVAAATGSRSCALRGPSPRPYRNPNHPSTNGRIGLARTDQQRAHTLKAE